LLYTLSLHDALPISFVGIESGTNITTGSGNTFLGRTAGLLSTTGSYNCFVGQSTAAGESSGFYMTTGSKNTILGGYNGNQGGLDIRTASNYIVLSDGDGNPRGIFDGSGNFLVGATTNATVANTAVKTNIVGVGTAASDGGIGVSLPNSTAGTIYVSNSVTSAGTGWNHFVGQSGNGSSITTNNIIIYGNGNIQNANNSYGSLSDLKLKENIVDATPKLDKLMQVRIRNYNLKGDYEQHKQIGVVAQELETVFPAMVEETPDRDKEGNDLGTTTKSVKYSVFVPMLIKAIQEQQAIIESLKARLDAANL
jgi:hypothetical protein